MNDGFKAIGIESRTASGGRPAARFSGNSQRITARCDTHRGRRIGEQGLELIARRWLHLSAWCLTLLMILGLAAPAAAETPSIAGSHFDLEIGRASFMTQSVPTEAPAGESWALQRLEVPQAWKLSSGFGVIVAVLDSGVSASHPALQSQVLQGWNFVNSTSDTSDDAGHGTFTAGIIAAQRSPDHAMAGIAPGAKILPVKILDSRGAGSTANFVAGINYAVDHGAKVINISASGVVNSQALADAVRYAEDHGAVVVASAGNHANGDMSYPAAYSSVVAVTASGPDDTVADFSSFGSFVDLAAPGVNVPSTWWEPAKGDTYLTASGSSAAAAYVSGVAALIISARPDLSPAQVRQVLTETAVDIGPPGIDASSGFGRVDAYLATRVAVPLSPGRPAAVTLVPEPGGSHIKVQSDGFQPEEPVALWLTGADGRHRVQRGITAGSSGALSADLGPAARFPEGMLAVTAVGRQSGVASEGQTTVKALPADPAFERIGPFDSSPDRVYFQETGHSLSGGFKTYWDTHGGLAVFGFPISEEFAERNPDTGVVYTVQYFERNRFEYHPEFSGTPFEVSLGRLGVQIAEQTFPPAPALAGQEGLRYFRETQHSISGPFLSYWESHGGLAIFGYPTSEPFEEHGRLVQYFERNRFEFHPDLPPENRVLLGRLGVDLARQEGYLQAS